MINVWIDEITPCLIDNNTGDIVETEVVQIKRKSFLQKYNKKNGWYTNWADLLIDCEIYALVIKGTVDIQGLVALRAVEDYRAVYIAWMCSAPINNPMLCDDVKYRGIGGHLFAIAAQKSVDHGFGGALTGFAMNEELVKHYGEAFNAEHLGLLHPNQIFIDEKSSQKIIREYDYEWTEDEL